MAHSERKEMNTSVAVQKKYLVIFDSNSLLVMLQSWSFDIFLLLSGTLWKCFDTLLSILPFNT